MGDHVLFFYGTLMAPPVLHRVIHGPQPPAKWQVDSLTIRPALLPNYRRHRVREADYPGIVATGKGESSVLGMVVAGLTDGDVHRLDMFEGGSGEERLEDAEWDFEAFKRDRMAWWVEADEKDW
ncbi:hypothetical protein BO70DRAFT_429866 [Aspergillus heteromorphus CBS 117.55]|uniref:Putative gamma-glutamylcyclotransferase n=1 Tax=Aspergillus heteromorphus CBS 117.55 TaxID=1448321 RepID=A0A317W198_9EURO|nr:uncharacterized protein BO70DRAFT_429866 [Aspergillus heteromorphus CBS 117.55]PWY79659.1 hypothetical protein BO70DRAFT_429866 [Aspergillus heteromorphus CBS 117.55]